MKAIFTEKAPEVIGTYSQAIKSHATVYLSGQIPLEPSSMQLCSEDIKKQISQVLENVSAVCEAAGGSLAHLVKINVYLTDLSYFSLVNEAMSHYLTKPYPARAVIGVSALPKGAKIEIDGIMVLK